MAKWRFQIHGGDYRSGKAVYHDGFFSKYFRFPGIVWPWQWKYAKDIQSVELVTDEMVKGGMSKAALGAAGLLLAGPLGATLGVLMGGKQKKETTFIVTFNDGKSFLATSNVATFQKLKSTALKRK
jgi:hypothetical protein